MQSSVNLPLEPVSKSKQNYAKNSEVVEGDIDEQRLWLRRRARMQSKKLWY